MLGLDALQTYLLIINAIAFVVFTIDYLVYEHTGGELLNHGLMCIFAVIGRPLGMLLAFLVWDHTPLLVYLAVINVATFVVFCVDKAKAVAGGYRIREFVLLGMSFAGGAVGGMLGMLIAHHKVNTYYFKYGLPIMLVIDVVAVAFLVLASL